MIHVPSTELRPLLRGLNALLVGLPVSLISALVNVAVFRYWEMAQDNVTQ